MLFVVGACVVPVSPISSAPPPVPPVGAPPPDPIATPAPPGPAAAPIAFGANLIVNGDAEAGAGTLDAMKPVTDIPGWTVTSRYDVVVYGARGDVPAVDDPGPVDRGRNFFTGGFNDAVSTATQRIDVSSQAAAIDAGVTYTLSAWVGGYATQSDGAVVAIDLIGANGRRLGQALIGPVTPIDRGSRTSLLQRSVRGDVPRGTRTILVTVTMTRRDGAYNDGYADNLSLVLAPN
jgi:hypothetical protein